MRGALRYGDEKIEYMVVRNARLTSKVRIHVHPDGAVEVEAPEGRSSQDIARAITKRARWVSLQLANVRANQAYALPRSYVSGETHFYLGRRYQLKVIETDREPPSVALKAGHIRVTLRKADPAAVRRRLREWYRDRAADYLARRLSDVSSTIGWLKHVPPIKLMTMKKQWGSCSPAGAIHLNPDLVRAPRDCIDYVIVHELCHLREHNHSKRYYNLLSRQLPSWKATKARLDAMAELLLVH